jgi:hypothetical protein
MWELQGNWRLYRANQAPTLRPHVVGAHGESVPRLLRPGFHSGTVPKLFARLRRAKTGGGKQTEALHHVQKEVQSFVERRLSAVLAAAASWAGTPSLQVGHVRLGCNRIRVELERPGAEGRAVFLDLEEHGGRLSASLTPAPPKPEETGPANGWLDRLTPEQTRALLDALAGFYKSAGVDVVREEVAELLPEGADFALEEQGLVVYSPRGVLYRFEDGDQLPPHALNGGAAAGARTLAADRLLYSRIEVRWDDWVEAWERDHAGKDHKPPLVRGVRLLPGSGKRTTARRR